MTTPQLSQNSDWNLSSSTTINKSLLLLIGKKLEQMKRRNILFNAKLNALMKNNKSLSNDYTDFNSAILLAAQATATKERTKNQGWFHHSEFTLLPEIQHRGQLLHHLRLKDPSEDNTAIKFELRAA